MTIPKEYSSKFFYHFTHLQNLESIVKNGFLSTNEKERLGISHKDIANGNIQERRHNMNVPIFPGGTVHDYVPFYLCTRNPMLLSVITSKNIDQQLMIFFAVGIDKLIDEDTIFTDASANTSIPPNFYTNPQDLDNLDWESITCQKWGVKSDDHRHRKMSEVLIYKKLEISAVDYIIVWNKDIKNKVEEIFKENNVECPVIVYEPFRKQNFYYTKFAMGRGGETLTTGPISLKNMFKNSIEKIIQQRKDNENSNYKFQNLEELLNAIEDNFCIIEELEGIDNLKVSNDVHNDDVKTHTLKVVKNVTEHAYFKTLNDEDKNILKLAAYLHDIGKGPKSKWKDGVQAAYSDHPVDSLKMLKRILVEDVQELSRYEIRMICLLVGYHDIIGEIFGKNRDKKQLFNILKTEEEFDMLDCLGYSDVKSFNNTWSLTYGVRKNKLKNEFLEEIKK